MGDNLSRLSVLPVIPIRKSRVNRSMYPLGGVVERCSNLHENARRVSNRYENTTENCLCFIDIMSIRLWLHHLSA